MLVSLGGFLFTMDIAPFHELQRERTWKHATNSRVGARDGSQYAGQGNDLITVSGLIIAGEIGSPLSLDALAGMADIGDAYVLIDGTGTVYGAYIIEGLRETQTYHNFLGVALKIEFTLTLRRVDDAAMAATVDGDKPTSTAKSGSLDTAPVPDAPAYVKQPKTTKKKS